LIKKLFTKREVKTSTFELNEEEFDFYDALTRFVEDQSIRASADDSAAGRAVGFIMAMLQRRMASSVYAVRRSLERMQERREHILADPEAYRRQRIERRIPDDYDELPEDEQLELLARLEEGEGINLQFCWFMINFDIPWNPVRLEQRMGRIHRYGQEHDCVILNFVAVNTNEGRVLAKLLERLREIRRELGTDQVFDVVGEIFPGNLLEKLFRDLYVRKTNVPDIEARIVRDVNPQRFRAITESTLEGLAKKTLNLSAIVGRSVEARERRLVPEVVEDFFVQAAPVAGIQPKTVAKGVHVYRVGKVPRSLISLGQRLEARFGHLGREYAKIAFDQTLLGSDPSLEWVTPGHPLFEVVREDVLERVNDHQRRGAVFFDLQREQPSRLDAFAASVKDG